MDELKERDPAELEDEPIENPADEGSDWKVVLQFFIIPLIIIASAAGVFLMFGLLTEESRTASEYLAEVRTGSKTRRYQAAYELSKYLVYKKEEALAEPGFAIELAHVFSELEGHEPEVRRYLALALGHMADPLTVDALLGGLGDPDSETRIYCIWALGAVGDPRAVPGLTGILSDADPGVRKMAAHSLGNLGDPAASPALQAALDDPVVDVAWNAALALGQLGDPAGTQVLLRMLDREYLEGVEGITPLQQEEVMVNAIKVLAALKGEGAEELIDRLAQDDPDMKVRSAAMTAQMAWRGES
ncbi:MAG: HEAT repeat domain-containing protein [Acidobacteria bacterium]|nr:MAG: HEAT repeat domain-containing protein [Acidobacteriota bacterium]